MISSDQTCLNCPDRVNGGAKTSTQWRINNGAIGARAPGPRAPGGPQILNKHLFGHNH